MKIDPDLVRAALSTLAGYAAGAFALVSVFYLTVHGQVQAQDYLTLVGTLLGAGGVHTIYQARSKSPNSPKDPS
jgi:hypothetical protein